MAVSAANLDADSDYQSEFFILAFVFTKSVEAEQDLEHTFYNTIFNPLEIGMLTV